MKTCPKCGGKMIELPQHTDPAISTYACESCGLIGGYINLETLERIKRQNAFELSLKN